MDAIASYLTSFFEPNKQPSPIEEAKAKGKLSLNETRVIDLPSTVKVKKGMFVCAPLASNGDSDLSECYKKIFETAVDNKVKTLLVPTFSTGLNGYAHEDAARIAVNEVFNFLQNNPLIDIHVQFVVYQNRNGSVCDEKNADAYQTMLNKLAPYLSDNKQRVSCCKSQIQYMDADMVVIPVDNDLNPGAVYGAIESASREASAPKPFTSTIWSEGGEDKQAPVQLDAFTYHLNPILTEDIFFADIFPSLERKDIGTLSCVNHQFNKALLEKSILNSFYGKDWGTKRSIFEVFPIIPVFFREEGLMVCWYTGNFFPTKGIRCLELPITQLSEAVRRVPIQEGGFKTATVVNSFPTFLVVGSKQVHYEQQCSKEEPGTISKHPHIFQQFIDNSTYAQQINLAVTYDAFGDNSVVSTTEIQALKAAIASQKANLSGLVFVYKNISPLVVMTMSLLGVFSIPAFFTAHTKKLDLNEQSKEEFNIVLDIKIKQSDRVRAISDEQVLISCYSRFKYLGSRMSDGLYVVSLETTDENEGSLPAGFDNWVNKRGEIPRCEKMTSSMLMNNVKILAESAKKSNLVSAEFKMFFDA